MAAALSYKCLTEDLISKKSFSESYQKSLTSSDEPTNSLDSSYDISRDGASSIVGRTGGGIPCCVPLCFTTIQSETKTSNFT